MSMNTKESRKDTHICENCKKEFEFEIREFTYFDLGHVTCPTCKTRQKIGPAYIIKALDAQ